MSRASLLASLMLIGWAFAPSSLSAQTFLNKNAQAWLAELENGNDSARRGAAFALGKLEAGVALNALQKHLQTDKDVWVREACAYALGEIGRVTTTPQVVSVLTTTMAKDSSPIVRRSAAFALGCLGANGLPALPSLDAALNDASPLVRQSVAWSLGKLGAPAIPALKKALRDKNHLVKRDAAASMEPPEAEVVRPLIPDLMQLCREKNSDVRRAALGVLIKAVNEKDGKYIPDVAMALNDGDEEVRNYAALTLANIGGDDSAQAVPQLMLALRQQGNLELRRQAAIAIRNIGPAAKKAVPDLIAALKDEDGELRTAAALALGGIFFDADSFQRLKEPLKSLGPDAARAYEALLQRVEDSKERTDTRVEAAFALSRFGRCKEAKMVVPRILTVVGNAKEPSIVRGRIIWAVRVHTIQELRNMGLYPTFYKVLGEPSTLENKMLRYDCAFMLGVLQNSDVKPEVTRTLLEFLRDVNVQIFDNKDSSVGGAGQESGPGGAKVEERGKGDGRTLAVDALIEIGRERLLEEREIIMELRALAKNAAYEPLRDKAKTLLKTLKK